MENINITNHTELQLHIKLLKAQKLSQEIEIKHAVKELITSLSAISMIKSSINEITHDKEIKFGIAKMGLNIGANYIIEKIVGRSKSIKGFLSSIIIEKISGAFINKNGSSIITSISNIIKPKE